MEKTDVAKEERGGHFRSCGRADGAGNQSVNAIGPSLAADAQVLGLMRTIEVDVSNRETVAKYQDGPLGRAGDDLPHGLRLFKESLGGIGIGIELARDELPCSGVACAQALAPLSLNCARWLGWG